MRSTTIILTFALLVPTVASAQSTREAWLDAREKTDRALEQARAASVKAPEGRQSDRIQAENLVTDGLSLTSSRIFADSDGFAVVVGEVQNVTGVTLSFPKAIFDFSDSSGFAGTYYSYAFGSQNGRVAATGAYTNILPPGATGFFKVPTFLNYVDITTYSFSSEAETFALAPVFANIQQLGSIGIATNMLGGTDFTGTVRNNSGSFTTFFTEVALAGYSNGVINDVEFTDVSGATIAACGTTSTSAVFPGATAGFSGSFSRPVTEIHRVAIAWDEYGIMTAAQAFGGDGGAGTVSVVSNCAWDAVANVPWITITGNASGTGDATVSFVVAPNGQQSRTGTMTIAGQIFTVTQDLGRNSLVGDFDGDRKIDITVFRPSTGIWYVRQSSTGTGAFLQWGLTDDVPVAGDYDGDGRTDVAVFRPSTGIWYVRNAVDESALFYQWGVDGDIPVPGDYDSDGKTDVAVFRPSNGMWYIRYSTSGAGAFFQWGMDGDVPVAADYNGDGRVDLAVFRPSTGIWYVRDAVTGNPAFYQWGLTGDIPVPGDYDGDGKTDVAVYRPSTGIWYVRNAMDETAAFYQWGADGDIPVPGDYDGDGKTDIAVFRPSNGFWYIRYSTTGTGAFFQWGNNGDIPILKRP